MMQRKAISQHNLALGFVLIWGSIMACMAVLYQGTGDEGDSIHHYLFASTAFEHPIHFLDHWAKPVYVLLSAPWAFFGFTTMKLWNVILMSTTLYFTYRAADKLAIKNAWLAPVLLGSMPLLVQLTLSGLTEPLFACFLILSIFLSQVKKYWVAAILISFLPFVRSEGTILLGVFALYFIFSKQWIPILLLAVGHIVYGVAGHLAFNNFNWIFNVPYASMGDKYAAGKLLHYVKEMPNIAGYILSLLLVVGLAWGAKQLVAFVQSKVEFKKEEIWLIYGGFLGFFVAHTLFFYLGNYGSMGLIRVFIAVMPLMAIICLRGINWILQITKAEESRYKEIILSACFFIPLGHMIDRVDAKYHLQPDASQRIINEAADLYWEQYRTNTLYFDAVHAALAFDKDWFNPNDHRITKQLFTGEPIPPGSLILWDDWYSVHEAQTPYEKIATDKRFSLLKEIQGTDLRWGNVRKIALFAYMGGTSNVLYSNNFDTISQASILVDSLEAFQGAHALRLDKTNEYSPGFTGNMNTVPQGGYVKCSFMVKISSIPAESWQQAKVAFTYETEGKVNSWYGIEVQSLAGKINEWVPVEVIQKIPAPLTEKDVMKVFVWNPQETPILIDNLSIELQN